RENYYYGGLFGDSNVNSLGFPTWDLLNILEEISRGEHSFGGPARFSGYEYTVNLGPIKEIVNSYYRTKGPYQSLGAIIEDCCSTFSYDFLPVIKPRDGEIVSNGVIENPEITVLLNDKRS